MTGARIISAGLAGLLLAGCSLGLGGGKPPPFLLTLAPSEAPAANDGQAVAADQALIITVPVVPQAIATARVPVARGDVAIAYVKDASWVEPPARMFQRLLAETVRARTGRPVLDGRQVHGATAILSGQLLHFEIDADKREAVAIYDATYNPGGRAALLTRRFEARVPVSEIAAEPVGRALNRAANQVAGEVAAWVKR